MLDYFSRTFSRSTFSMEQRRIQKQIRYRAVSLENTLLRRHFLSLSGSVPHLFISLPANVEYLPAKASDYRLCGLFGVRFLFFRRKKEFRQSQSALYMVQKYNLNPDRRQAILDS